MVHGHSGPSRLFPFREGVSRGRFVARILLPSPLARQTCYLQHLSLNRLPIASDWPFGQGLRGACAAWQAYFRPPLAPPSHTSPRRNRHSPACLC